MDKKNCFNCRYYLGKEHTCMKMWEFKCVKDEHATAKNCKDFIEGDYNEKLIEEEYWDAIKS